jgi:predicted CoA-binding protein
MTREERDRAAAFLDLQEGRGPVPILDDAGIERALRATRRIAVIGASANPGRPSFAVFRYLVQQGFECVAINPNERHVLGIPAFRTLAEAVAAGARFLWLQLGVVNWEAARIAHDAGLEVVMDRCTAIEWRRLDKR